MAVSQGLRSLTQTLGCVVSLYLISPQMTALVGVALPVMITVGTMFGAVLRQWSRQAQEQASSPCVCMCVDLIPNSRKESTLVRMCYNATSLSSVTALVRIGTPSWMSTHLYICPLLTVTSTPS